MGPTRSDTLLLSQSSRPSSHCLDVSVRHEFAEPRATLAVLREFENARCDRELALPARHRGEPLAHADARGQVLTATRGHLRLGIEEVHLRRCAALEEVDNTLRLWREVGQPRQGSGGLRLPVYQTGERGHADATGCFLQKRAARHTEAVRTGETEKLAVIAIHGWISRSFTPEGNPRKRGCRGT